MKAHVRSAGDVRMLDLEGDIKLGIGDLVLREAFQALLEEGHEKIVLNLEGIRYVDSAGLAEIIACKKLAQQRGGDLKLLKPQEKVQRLLVMSRLSDIFGIYEVESEAIGSF